MSGPASRSVSDTDVSILESEQITPENICMRYKRKRSEEYTSDLNSFKEEIKLILSNQEQELKKILSQIQNTNQNIQSSVALLAEQNIEFKKRIDKLENTIQEDKKYIITLESKIEDLQMGMRKANFELKNVPKKIDETKEDLIEMVECLSKSVGCSMKRSDIKDIYRVRPKKEGSKNTPIVVETTSTLMKTEILKLCKVYNAKHKTKLRAMQLGFRVNENTPIFISEQLTVKGSRLHFLARDLAKSKKYKYCWTAYGKVYVRKDENSPIICIKSETQVHELIKGQ